MWVCQHCHSENKDTSATCEACGTPRPVRRFGSAPQVRTAASVSASAAQVPAQQNDAAPSSVPDARAAAAVRAAYQQASVRREDEDYDEEEELYDRPRRGGSIFGKLVGGLLIVLLPLLVGLLAWRQYDALSEALLPLYLTEKAPEWLHSVFYGLLTAAAVLLSMLPGLWTILLSRKPIQQGD